MGLAGDFNPFKSGAGSFNKDLEKIRQPLAEGSQRTTSYGGEVAAAEPGDEAFHTVVRRLVEFERRLDPAQEVGMRLAAFGQALLFRIDDLSRHRPGLIVFYGTGEDGRPLELIQHASQVSLLLTGIDRPDPAAARGEKGFHRLYRQLFEAPAAAPADAPTEAGEQQGREEDKP